MNPETGNTMRRPSDVAPSLPVWDGDYKREMMADNVSFQLDTVSMFKSRNGPAWRAYITRHDTGEQGIVLFGANDVRDQQMRQFANAIESSGSPIGPCALAMNKLESGRETWEIVDHTPSAKSK